MDPNRGFTPNLAYSPSLSLALTFAIALSASLFVSDEGELQSLFRALKMNMRIEETQVLMEMIPKSLVDNLNFENFVKVLFFTIENRDKVHVFTNPTLGSHLDKECHHDLTCFLS